MKKIGIAFILLVVLLNGKNCANEEYAVDCYDAQDIKKAVSSDSLHLNATSAILYDKTYQKVLYEKNAHERVPNASTTKMLTAIVAYENANVSDMVIVGKNAAFVNGSTIQLRSGDVVTLDGLIKGLLVHSGNDCAIAISEYVGGSVENFCEMMNDKAKEMGLLDTHFVTPHGLDAEGHYSSAYDLVVIADYLLEVPYLANIVKQKSVTIQLGEQNKILTTTNEMLSTYEGTNGVKTGYTGEAGRCLVTSCTQNGRTLVTVVLGCGTKAQRTKDSILLLDYGFQEFEVVNLCEKMKKEFWLTVEKGKNSQYTLLISGEIYQPIKKENLDKISYQYDIQTNLRAPVSKKEKIGTIRILVDGKIEKIIEIEIPQELEIMTFYDYFKNFFKNMIFYDEIHG